MITYNDGQDELKVMRCPAGLYIVAGLPFMQNAIKSKVVAQNFLISYAVKNKMKHTYDFDADLYGECGKEVCKMCIAFRNGRCTRNDTDNKATT